MLDELNGAVEGVVSVVQQAPRLVFMRGFAPYFEGKPSGLNPPAIIRATPLFQVGGCLQPGLAGNLFLCICMVCGLADGRTNNIMDRPNHPRHHVPIACTACCTACTAVPQKLRSEINETILEDYNAAREYVRLFEDYRKVYDFGRTWSHEEYTSQVC